MIEVRETPTFTAWMEALKDRDGRAKITARLRRLAMGNPGDVKSVGGQVSELRVDHGPGYRIYFTRRGVTVALLLCSGDKRTQAKDIKLAQSMVSQLE